MSAGRLALLGWPISVEDSGCSDLMTNKLVRACLAGAFLILGGCAFTDEALVPSLSGEPAPAPNQTVQAAPVSPGATTTTPAAPTAPGTVSVEGSPQQFNTGEFQPGGVTPGQPTGTAVGAKVDNLRGDLMQLQANVASQNDRLQTVREQAAQNAVGYHNTVATIDAKLQVGTTPGNPILVSQWNQAQSQLQQVNIDLGQMNGLANDVAASAAMSSYLLEATRAAFGISGAVDEDHRQLAILEDETNRTTVLIDRLLTELTEDIARQTNYLGSERNNLNTLALAINNGELYGASLAGRQFSPVSPGTLPGSAIASGRPLVLIRFDRQNVDYEQALFAAVSAALDRRPDAAFDLVAVTPGIGSQAQISLAREEARRDAERVLRSLTSMGLSPNRVSLSTMTSPAAQTNEVHLYVR